MLSIIIPIYNVEKYLERCIESILNQENFELNNENIEIILVNDGSTDNSQVIIDSYVKKYEYIKCFNKINGGSAESRNFGLRRAIGNYIWFIDSDDWIDKKSLSTIFNEIKKNQLEILEFDFVKAIEKPNGKMNYKINTFYNSISLEKMNGIRVLEEFGYVPGMCYKVVKRNLLLENNLFFPEGELNEDNLIVYQLLKKCVCYKKITHRLYYYYNNNNSNTTNVSYEHRYNYIKNQINNLQVLNTWMKSECFDVRKIKEMQFFNSTNIIFLLLKLRNKAFFKESINKISEAGLYPIGLHTYHNKGFKRRVFIGIINNRYLLKMFSKLMK